MRRIGEPSEARCLRHASLGQERFIAWPLAVLVLILICHPALAGNLFAKSTDIISNLVPTDFEVDRRDGRSGGSSARLKATELTFVNFHSSSCSHCINHAPTWVEFAKAMALSGAVVAAIDCDEYRDLCSEFKIVGTPSIKVFCEGVLVKENVGESLDQLFSVAHKEFNVALVLSGQKAVDASLKMLEDHHSDGAAQTDQRTGRKDFDPVAPPPSAEANRAKKKQMEASSSSSSASSDSKGDAKKSSKGNHIKSEESPTATRRTLRSETRDVLPKSKILNDAALAIRYGLEKGVFLGKFVLSKEEETALLRWLDLLRRAFPSASGRWKLDWFYQGVTDLARAGPIASKAFDELLTGWGFARRFDEGWNWQYCHANSRKEGAGAGYTCGLWLLFHALSVNQARTPSLKDLDIATAIHGFVMHFFSCNECRENFLKHNPRPFKSEIAGDTFAFAMWLWREHNFVSNRLNHEDEKEGIKRTAPREMFPPLEMCGRCRRIKENGLWEFDESVVVRYLDHAFSGFPENEEVAFTNDGGAGTSRSLFEVVVSGMRGASRTFWYILGGVLTVGGLLWLKKRRKRFARLMKRSKN